MIEDLNEIELRIIGCLLEKAVTTPDQYPLTLNALTNACNQKSSRNPVMDLTLGEVQRMVRRLKDRRLISVESGARGNVEKYEQRFCNTLLGDLKFDSAQYALICLLMLRGAQTPGELRSRSGRLSDFEDNQAVLDCLKSLIERESSAIVARLPRKQGRMDHEYVHLFSGKIESAPEESTVIQRATVSSKGHQINALEARIAVLETALLDLAGRFGETIDLNIDVTTGKDE